MPKRFEKSNGINSFPIIIDSNNTKEYLNYWSERDPTWLSTASYRIYNIGKFPDTIFLNYFIDFSGHPRFINREDSVEYFSRPGVESQYKNYKKYFTPWPIRKGFKFCTEASLSIRFDTTQLFYNYLPVIITNLNEDTIQVNADNLIPLIMEAKDSLGVWRPIQELLGYCGTGVGTLGLPPKESVLTFAHLFDGDYKTDLRLRLGKNYSKSFKGKIVYRQFKSMFENGDYCEEYKMELEKKKNEINK